MQLSDVDIKRALKNKEIIIRDFDEKRLQPASYDVLLGYEFIVFDNHKKDSIDPKENSTEYTKKVVLESENDYFVLHPNQFALGVTLDYFGVNKKHACQIMGKSSLARLGLIIHTTAGFVDPGNELNATLEFVNVNTLPIKLYPKMKIAQIAFFELKTEAEKHYGHPNLNSKYYKSKGVESSQMWKNF
jgi:dCTP deaminase